MDLTGNPFVDTGLMVLSSLAGKDRASDLTLADIRAIFGDGAQLARDNQRLKCFTMVFGTNGPLTQYAYQKIGKNVEIYTSIVRATLDWAEREGSSGPRCDLTGIPTDFDFHLVCSRALRDAGLGVPERKWLGRDFVPLGGSLGNDAQALPVASRPLHVSALALFALQYLPLGVFLFKGGLTCYQSTAVELTQALVGEVVEKNRQRLSLGETEILGKGSGTAVLLDFLLQHFENLQEALTEWSLPVNTELLLWLFSNSGTGADCEIEPVPAPALRFIYEGRSAGFSSEIRRLASNDSKDTRSQLLECIRTARDYRGLYPYKKHSGASPEFYEFYQQQIRGATKNALLIARKLAAMISSGSSDRKRLKEISSPDFLNSGAGRSLVRKYIVEYLSLEEYDALFPSSRHPIKADPSGWQFLRYYLSRAQDDSRTLSPMEFGMSTTHPKIIQMAEAYVAGKDPKKIKNLLDRMAQRKIGIRWLEDVFCKLAEDHADWNLGTWDEFVLDEDGKPITFELFFQMRLYLSNLYRQAISAQQKEIV